MNYLLGYTRKPVNNLLYDARLAYSLHLALSDDGKTFSPLNHHSGVFFPLATENKDGSLNPTSLKAPYLFALRRGGYGVVAVRLTGDAGYEEASLGQVVLAVTDDFLAYREIGLIRLCDVYVDYVGCDYSETEQCYHWCFRTELGEWYEARTNELPDRGNADRLVAECAVRADADRQIELEELLQTRKTAFASFSYQDMPGNVPQSILEIPDEVACRLKKKLITPRHIGVELPERVEAKTRQELEATRAVCRYSDGTSIRRRVKWDLSGVDFTLPGEYPIQGELEQAHFEFPVAYNRADPCITCWEGSYYFIATNDADWNHTLYIRKADTLEGLVSAEEHLILDSSTYEGIGGLLWAPEFHEINGELYIFHAATPGEFFHEESHIIKLRTGGDPTKKEDWSAPRRIVRQDGSDLCEAGKTISLDMTCFLWENEYYVIWSQREFLPKDLGAWLYIAKLDQKEPWKLSSEPVVLSKPDYAWGNNHTFVEEGPFALMTDKRLYITFSAAAVDTSYVVSYLEIEAGKDLLVRGNWRKNNYPILTSRSVEGEYGTGHNAYVIDEDGFVWNTYHARPGTDGVRSSGVRRVHFDIDGAPMLDVTEEMDLDPALKTVTTLLCIKK